LSDEKGEWIALINSKFLDFPLELVIKEQRNHKHGDCYRLFCRSEFCHIGTTILLEEFDVKIYGADIE